MEFFYSLLILLVVTRICGEAAERLGQPALVGELVSGILLGLFVTNVFPDAVPAISGDGLNEVFLALVDLGVFFLMLYAGVEMNPADLAEESGKSFVIALGGVLVPFSAGFSLGWYWLPESDYLLAQSFFLGTALAITAIPVAVTVLIDLDMLHTRPGKFIVSAAIIDDIIGIVLLAVLTGLIETGETPGLASFAVLVGKIGVFFLIAWIVGS